MKDHDLHFLELAKLISTRSKDPSTKTGAVIVDKMGRIISTGYNGFPRRMPDSEAAYSNREEKYSRIVHCEMNALIFSHRELTECTLYTWPFLSCDRCAVHMIQAGIERFVAPVCPEHLKERWEPVFQKSRLYMDECSVVHDEIDLDQPMIDVKNMTDEELWNNRHDKNIGKLVNIERTARLNLYKDL